MGLWWECELGGSKRLLVNQESDMDKTVLITVASRGIGAARAALLAARQGYGVADAVVRLGAIDAAIHASGGGR
jgi:NAD(P)-dependent dehydrogenase (short-subunit alcohol dehydrogenase family)